MIQNFAFQPPFAKTATNATAVNHGHRSRAAYHRQCVSESGACYHYK